MSIKSLDELYGLLREDLQKKNTNMRVAIGPMERLIITLRYLATGADFAALEYVFQVSKSAIRLFGKLVWQYGINCSRWKCHCPMPNCGLK
ncbi:hypothetical protein JTB14_016419 [Gonioctena quinquepunctata]|nr:hypothetical protein JTB14_016419 [Gonioctena quinquepunctata]